MFSFGEICRAYGKFDWKSLKNKKKLVWLKIKYHYTAFIYTYLGWVCKWNLRINHKSFNWQLNAFHLYYKKNLNQTNPFLLEKTEKRHWQFDVLNAVKRTHKHKHGHTRVRTETNHYCTRRSVKENSIWWKINVQQQLCTPLLFSK